MIELIKNILKEQGIEELLPFRVEGNADVYAYKKDEKFHICNSEFTELQRKDIQLEAGCFVIEQTLTEYCLSESGETNNNPFLVTETNDIITHRQYGRKCGIVKVGNFYVFNDTLMHLSVDKIELIEVGTYYTCYSPNTKESIYYSGTIICHDVSQHIFVSIAENTEAKLNVYVYDNEGNLTHTIPGIYCKKIWLMPNGEFIAMGDDDEYLSIYLSTSFDQKKYNKEELFDRPCKRIYYDRSECNEHICVCTLKMDINENFYLVINSDGNVEIVKTYYDTALFNLVKDKFCIAYDGYHEYYDCYGNCLGQWGNEDYSYYKIVSKTDTHKGYDDAMVHKSVLNTETGEYMFPFLYSKIEISQLSLQHVYSIVTIDGYGDRNSYSGLYFNKNLISPISEQAICFLGNIYAKCTSSNGISIFAKGRKIYENCIKVEYIGSKDSCFEYLKVYDDDNNSFFIFKEDDLLLEDYCTRLEYIGECLIITTVDGKTGIYSENTGNWILNLTDDIVIELLDSKVSKDFLPTIDSFNDYLEEKIEILFLIHDYDALTSTIMTSEGDILYNGEQLTPWEKNEYGIYIFDKQCNNSYLFAYPKWLSVFDNIPKEIDDEHEDIIELYDVKYCVSTESFYKDEEDEKYYDNTGYCYEDEDYDKMYRDAYEGDPEAEWNDD